MISLNSAKSFLKTNFPNLVSVLANIVTTQNRSRGSFNSYSEALASCETKSGYDSNFLSQYLVEKTKYAIDHLDDSDSKLIPDHLLQSFFVALLARTENSKINVVDFGGGCGYPYAVLRHLYNIQDQISWHVVEVPSLVSLAAEKISLPNLHFSHSIDEVVDNIGKIDLLHSACTLQYVDTPRVWLEKLVKYNSKYIFFGRAGFADGENDFITIQRSRIKDHGLQIENFQNPEGFVEYPVTFISKNYFLSYLLEHNYKQILEFGASSVFKPKNGPTISEGAYFFERIDSV